jgi:hypothetical protein
MGTGRARLFNIVTGVMLILSVAAAFLFVWLTTGG